jgi:hypothetical protein
MIPSIKVNYTAIIMDEMYGCDLYITASICYFNFNAAELAELNIIKGSVLGVELR